MAAHAKIFGASNCHRWAHCAAAPAREEGRPNTGSEFAREGTAGHFLAAYCLETGENAIDHLCRTIVLWEGADSKGEAFLDNTPDMEGELTTWLIEVTEDMVEAVTSYVEFVRHVRDTTGGELFVETRVDYRQWLPAGIDTDDGFGTADAIIVSESEIAVFDLKMGRGEKVDAKDNDQLRLYALGAYAEHSVLNDFKTVRVGIIQPRKGGASEWSYPLEDVLAFGEWIKGRAQAVLDGCDVGTPGDKVCRWCRAKATCPELKALALEAVFGDFTNLDAEQTVVPQMPDLVTCYQKVSLIEGWCAAIKERMYEETMAGAVPDYKIVEGRKGNRTWANPVEAEATLKAMRLKQDQMYSLKLVGPAAIEKALKDKPRSLKKVSGLITQPGGKLTIAHISDPRQAVAKLADDFDTIPADADLF